MAAQPKHRQAIIQAAAALFRRRGYAATGLNDIVARGRAPKGSLYHYFPGGKAQLGEAAVRAAGEVVRRTLEQIAETTPHAAGLMTDYTRRLADWTAQSGWRDGCPVATVLLEMAGEDEAIRLAGREVLASWAAIIAAALERDGVRPEAATTLAGFAISALEGCLVRARVEQSETPILEAGAMLAALFDAAAQAGP